MVFAAGFVNPLKNMTPDMDAAVTPERGTSGF
jgi:hypothetical protein